MITLAQFLKATNYAITSSSPYQWQCYGPAARWLDCGSELNSDWTASVIFDTVTQEVYSVEVHDELANRSYRLSNPEYRAAYLAECTTRKVDPQEASEDIKFTELEVDEDWLEKAEAIVNGHDYDDRVMVSIDFDDDLLLDSMLAAHRLDITFNEYIERALQAAIDATEKKL